MAFDDAARGAQRAVAGNLVQVRTRSLPPGLLLGLAGGAFLALGVLAVPDSVTASVAVASSALLILGAGVLIALSRAAQAQADVAASLPDALEGVRAEVGNLESVRREHAKLRASMEDFAGAGARVAAVATELGAVARHLEAIDKDLGETRLQAHAAERREEETVRSIAEFLQSEERGFRNEAARPEDRDAAERRARDLVREMGRCGLSLIEPAPGDAVTPADHEVTAQESTDSVADGSVLRCQAWGYRFRGRVLFRARVVRAVQRASARPESVLLVEGAAPPAPDRSPSLTPPSAEDAGSPPTTN